MIILDVIFSSKPVVSCLRELSNSNRRRRRTRNTTWKPSLQIPGKCCCCLPCTHCSNWTWVADQILAYGYRLHSTHYREFLYLKLCRPAYFVTWLYMVITTTATVDSNTKDSRTLSEYIITLNATTNPC